MKTVTRIELSVYFDSDSTINIEKMLANSRDVDSYKDVENHGLINSVMKIYGQKISHKVLWSHCSVRNR